jgi:hypothetical protein
MRPARIIATVVIAAAVAVTGCSAHSTAAQPAAAPPASPTGPEVTASTRVATNPTSEDGPDSEPAVLADGRHAVLLKTVDAGRRRVTFDLIQFYQGDAATTEAAKDHQESPPPNDVYSRNVNPRLRTLPVRSDATITCNTLTAGYTGSATKNLQVPLDRLAIVLPRGGAGPFWITVRHDQVVKIAEQYMP